MDDLQYNLRYIIEVTSHRVLPKGQIQEIVRKIYALLSDYIKKADGAKNLVMINALFKHGRVPGNIEINKKGSRLKV